MQKYNVFVRWWLIIALIALGSFALYQSGIIEQVNKIDFTKISFLIYSIFAGFSVYTGINTCKVSKLGEDIRKEDLEKFTRRNEIGWFISDIFLTLGMIGTVAGFIYMLSTSFSGIDPTSKNTMIEALTSMAGGMGTALYTTAAGLVCSLLLKLQLFNLSYHMDNLLAVCMLKITDNCTCKCKGDENVTE